MFGAFVLASVLFGGTAASPADSQIAGAFRSATGHLVYIGVERELPDPAYRQYYDDVSRRIGDAQTLPALRRVATVHEAPLHVTVNGTRLGFSVWYTSSGRRPTILLIHGNDDETRAMGFLIPYFALHGMTVISYDQRGTGESAGNWRNEGPADRARDVVAMIASVKTNAHVDSHRLGLWAFSNGGWTAPIVAGETPIAFMILKSAPAETLQDNILYEVDQRMREHRFSPSAIASAMNVDRTLINALQGRTSWDAARRAFTFAKTQKWFPDSALPAELPMPPPPPVLAALSRAVIYDPAPVLRRVRTPTLALFGTLDRNVNVGYSTKAFLRYFKYAGVRDFTERVFSRAGHTLAVSDTGYTDQPALPRRLVPYMPATIAWLRARGYAGNSLF